MSGACSSQGDRIVHTLSHSPDAASTSNTIVSALSAAAAIGLIVVTACGREMTQPPPPAGPRSVLVESTNAWVLERGLFSPTSASVAVVGMHDGADAVGVLDPGSSSPRLLPVDGAHAAAWFPDGETLVLAVRDDVSRPDSLVIVEPDGTVVEGIEPDLPVRLEDGFSVAPNGRSMIVSYQEPGVTDTYADLATIDLQTGEVEMVTSTSDVSETFPEFVDERRVVFSRGALVADAGKANGVIAILHLETDGATTLTPDDHIAGTAAVLDEQTVVYDAISGADDEPGLWRVGTDGTGAPELVSRGPGRYPSVSADGSEALLLEPVFGGSKVVLVKLNGR